MNSGKNIILLGNDDDDDDKNNNLGHNKAIICWISGFLHLVAHGLEEQDRHDLCC